MGWSVGMGVAGIRLEQSKERSLQHLGTLPQALHEQAASQAGDTHGSPCSRHYGTIYRAT